MMIPRICISLDDNHFCSYFTRAITILGHSIQKRPQVSATKLHHKSLVLLYFVIIFTIYSCGQITVAQSINQTEILLAPAEFAFYFNPPGASEKILRPKAIYFDRHFGEIFVTDQGHNRVMIFDRDGHFKFEFTGESYFNSALDIAVDAQGYIWILGSSAKGRKIFKYDFDGLYISTFEIPKMYNNASVEVASYGMSDRDLLYLYDQINSRILIMDTNGVIKSSFEVLANIELSDRMEQVVGKVRVCYDHLIIVSGTVGSAYIYDLSGKLQRKVGKKGSELGQMTFPIAATMTANGAVIILDKMSHNFVIYDSLGQAVAEIGGKGLSPGWFYQPSLLEIDDRGRIFIGQIHQSRVQACNLPALPILEQSKQSLINNYMALDHEYKLANISIDNTNIVECPSDAMRHLETVSGKRNPRRYF